MRIISIFIISFAHILPIARKRPSTITSYGLGIANQLPFNHEGVPLSALPNGTTNKVADLFSLLSNVGRQSGKQSCRLVLLTV